MANVIIFGEAGKGKSSVINMLLDQHALRSKEQKVQYAITGDGAEGVTFECAKYPEEDTFVLGDKNVTLWDTIGLSEAKSSATKATAPEKALANLRALIMDLSNAGGVSLMVMVMQKGRVTDAARMNYKLFVDGFCNGEVPFLLLITRCEDCEPLDAWLFEKGESTKAQKTNKEIIVDCGIKEHDKSAFMCVSAVAGDKKRPFLYEAEYDESREKVKAAIEKLMLPTPWQYKGGLAAWLVWTAKYFGMVMTTLSPGTAASIPRLVANFVYRYVPNVTKEKAITMVADEHGVDVGELYRDVENKPGLYREFVKMILKCF